ncbi:hypothetical protein AV530_016417 [Patagioenas fasciata monilis]|uniref:Uncharacterized protein n=1 Tax=Patagioenas fasciata monilis TaxID=372326 RepID=A0A1V4JTK7_PATFA|nr:hypothetical protein AV530_016417 [Patagioenas fasciata monilis]
MQDLEREAELQTPCTLPDLPGRPAAGEKRKPSPEGKTHWKNPRDNQVSVGFQTKEEKRSCDTSIGGRKPGKKREEPLGQAVVRRRLSWESIQTQDKVLKQSLAVEGAPQIGALQGAWPGTMDKL